MVSNSICRVFVKTIFIRWPAFRKTFVVGLNFSDNKDGFHLNTDLLLQWTFIHYAIVYPFVFKMVTERCKTQKIVDNFYYVTQYQLLPYITVIISVSTIDVMLTYAIMLPFLCCS